MLENGGNHCQLQIHRIRISFLYEDFCGLSCEGFKPSIKTAPLNKQFISKLEIAPVDKFWGEGNQLSDQSEKVRQLRPLRSTTHCYVRYR